MSRDRASLGEPLAVASNDPEAAQTAVSCSRIKNGGSDYVQRAQHTTCFISRAFAQTVVWNIWYAE
jgi:hypothetical protein